MHYRRLEMASAFFTLTICIYFYCFCFLEVGPWCLYFCDFFFFGPWCKACGIIFPDQGLNLCLLQWELGVLTTED